MDPVANGFGSIELTPQELTSVEQYRRLKETSVLVILFTDIKGFTQMTENQGEAYSQTVRRAHDEILVGTIEEDHAGLVIKHIGDSVMAVFSEPSTAVAKALKIQDRIRQFNQSHPELESIQVRIGIHMGQVSVENKTQLDLFGRHVNRASRVEGLADGGQIFITYPVFDSAKGWLKSRDTATLTWKLHGRYFLKGIENPVEIYEVVDTRFQQPRPPLKARKKSTLPPWSWSAALVLLGVSIPLVLMQLKRTEVWFVKWYPEQTIIDQKTELVLDGDKTLEARKAMIPIAPGKHLLHYDIHWQLKYYMEIEIKPGKNYLKPNFTENFLPSLSRRLEFSRTTPGLEAQQDFKYLLYDKQNRRSDHQANIRLAIQGQEDPQQRDRVTFTYHWLVTLDGKTISQSQLQLHNLRSNAESQTQHADLYADAEHYWYRKIFISRDATELEIGSAYIEYKNK